MTTIKLQKIVDAMKTAFAGITKANGYYTDIGLNLKEWEAIPFAEEETPGLNLEDGEENEVSPSISGPDQIVDLHKQFRLSVIALGTSAPSIARQGIMDLYKVIRNNLTWGDNAIDTRFIGISPAEVDQAERKVIGLTLTIQVHYRTKYFDEA